MSFAEFKISCGVLSKLESLIFCKQNNKNINEKCGKRAHEHGRVAPWASTLLSESKVVGSIPTTGKYPAHELRCLRRWLHSMEGRLPPPALGAARAAPYHELMRKLSEHQ
ncbi:jg14905, partial [Pararge aegeria aegeria]